MAGILIVLGGLVIVGGCFQPWLHVGISVATIGDAAGTPPDRTRLLEAFLGRTLTIDPRGFDSGYGKLVVVLGIVVGAAGVLRFMGADAVARTAALFSCLPVGVAWLWYHRHSFPAGVVGVEQSVGRGIWIVAAGAGLAIVGALVGSYETRSPARGRPFRP